MKAPELKWGVFIDPIYHGWALSLSVFGAPINGEYEFGVAIAVFKWTIQIGRIVR